MTLGLLVALENADKQTNTHTRFMFYKYRYDVKIKIDSKEGTKRPRGAIVKSQDTLRYSNQGCQRLADPRFLAVCLESLKTRFLPLKSP